MKFEARSKSPCPTCEIREACKVPVNLRPIVTASGVCYTGPNDAIRGSNFRSPPTTKQGRQ